VPRVSRARLAISLVGAAGGLAVVAALILSHADDIGDALGRVGAGRFALVVALAALAMVLRTAAWQVAIDSAGGRVRTAEAHAASGAAYSVALLFTYLGFVVRIAVIRHWAPERSPTASQQVAAESLLFVVEGTMIGALLLGASWTLGLSPAVALLIFLGGLAAAAAMALAARRLAPRQFGAGLAAARDPRAMGLVAASLGGTLALQLARVALVLGAVGLDTDPFVVVAVFLASGLGAVIPIGTAASGTAAPLIAASAGGDSVADATAAGVLLSGSMIAACLGYLAVALLALVRSRRAAPQSPPSAT
jgi:hypothetical protein